MSQIKANFSSAAQTYESHSLIQKQMAEALYQETMPHASPGRFMEYGIGTGHLSQLLHQDNKVIELDLVDFSLPMLFQAQMKLGGIQANTRTNFIEADIEQHNLPTCASTYISNATIQWLRDFDGFVAKCSQRLDSGSIMSFSAFSDGHFQEFYQSAQEVFPQFDQRQVRLYSADQLRTMALAHGFEVISLETQVVVEEFDSLAEILKYISKMGAQDQSHAYPLTPGRWRAWQELYAKNKTTHGKLPLTWEYHLVVLKRT